MPCRRLCHCPDKTWPRRPAARESCASDCRPPWTPTPSAAYEMHWESPSDPTIPAQLPTPTVLMAPTILKLSTRHINGRRYKTSYLLLCLPFCYEYIISVQKFGKKSIIGRKNGVAFLWRVVEWRARAGECQLIYAYYTRLHKARIK